VKNLCAFSVPLVFSVVKKTDYNRDYEKLRLPFATEH
jgi:hypothetical protein